MAYAITHQDQDHPFPYARTVTAVCNCGYRLPLMLHADEFMDQPACNQALICYLREQGWLIMKDPRMHMHDRCPTCVKAMAN
jgi:hypothetical protein